MTVRPLAARGARVAAALALLGAPAAAQVPGWDRGLDAELDSIRKAWKIPGMAVGIVAKGKVIHLKGYGKLAWDDRVRQHVPEFLTYDPVVTDRITVRDLVTMRTGLARHDLLWGIDVFPRAELVRRIRHVAPNQDFRTAWQYQNLMFTAAGYLGGPVNGTDWETLVRTRVIESLGMARTSPVLADYERDDDFTRPYALRDDGVVRLVARQRNSDPLAPTGGIHSTLADMMAYLTLHMQGGDPSGARGRPPRREPRDGVQPRQPGYASASARSSSPSRTTTSTPSATSPRPATPPATGSGGAYHS